MYPANKLKEDEYYFLKEKAKCNSNTSNKAKRLDKKRSRRREHFLHAITKDIVETCKEKNVGTIVVGDLSGIRLNNYNDNFNLKISQWPFNKFVELLQYKAKEVDITVRKVDESQTSKTCSSCEVVDGSNRTQRGLYECSNCGVRLHADVNGACNILQKVTALRGSNGCLAQPTVNLFTVRSGDSNEQGTFRKEHLKTLNSQTSQACA
jgi:putative transposase